MSRLRITPEDCETYARAQETEGRAHVEAAIVATERAARCHLSALNWRLQAQRIREQEAGPLDHENDVREPHPNAEAAKGGAS